MDITLNDQKAQDVLYIRKHVGMDKLPQTIGESYGAIMRYLNELGAQASGEPYTAYHNLNMQDMDVEMGFPVSKPMPPQGEIKSGRIAASRVVSALYVGPYSGLEIVYNEIFKWIAEKGLKLKDVYYEYYYNSPQEVPEKELLTKVVMPVEKGINPQY
jgi:effector-binding domain-containing protein